MQVLPLDACMFMRVCTFIGIFLFEVGLCEVEHSQFRKSVQG